MPGTTRTRRAPTLTCNPAERAALQSALRQFAAAAYPPGGSECAQAARAGLLQIADQRLTPDAGAELTIPRRQRPLLRSAVAWCQENAGDLTPPIDSVALAALAAQLAAQGTTQKDSAPDPSSGPS